MKRFLVQFFAILSLPATVGILIVSDDWWVPLRVAALLSLVCFGATLAHVRHNGWRGWRHLLLEIFWYVDEDDQGQAATSSRYGR